MEAEAPRKDNLVKMQIKIGHEAVTLEIGKGISRIEKAAVEATVVRARNQSPMFQGGFEKNERKNEDHPGHLERWFVKPKRSGSGRK